MENLQGFLFSPRQNLLRFVPLRVRRKKNIHPFKQVQRQIAFNVRRSYLQDGIIHLVSIRN